MIFYQKNLQIDPSSFAFVTHLCLEQVWTDSEEKGIKKGKIQKSTGVDAHMKANSIKFIVKSSTALMRLHITYLK